MIIYLLFYIITLLIVFTIVLAYFYAKNALFSILFLNTVVFSIGILIMLFVPQYYTLFMELLSLNTHYPLSLSLITGMFTHLTYLHIFANMVVLFFIGLPFEDRVGARAFILIYMLSGIIAELVFSAFYYSTYSFLLGASGAIFGIMGAFLVLYPNDEIPMLLGFILMPKIKVKYAVMFFAGVEFLATALFIHNGVAHLAHVTGFVAGAIIAYYTMHKLPVKHPSLDITVLEAYANTEQLKKILAKIKTEKIEMLKKIWIEQFFTIVFNSPAKIKGHYVIVKGQKLKLFKK